MIGQGSPSSIIAFNSTQRFLFPVILALVLSFLCAHRLNGQTLKLPRLGVTTKTDEAPVSSDSLDEADAIIEPGMRFRLSWGGGETRQWSGFVSVSQGHFSDVAILGLTADAPGSIVPSGDQLLINHWTPTSFGGVDVSIADRDAELKIVLFPADQPENRFERTIEISQIRGETFSETLDASDNRFSVGRVPGDLLPVHFRRDHLIFSPGEEFEIGVQANHTGWSERRTNCRLKLFPDLRRTAISRVMKTVQLPMDQYGTSPVVWTSINVPQKEGVYELQIELDAGWQHASFGKGVEVKRSIQFVVVSEAAPNTDGPWKLLNTTDPTAEKSTNAFAFGQWPKLNPASHQPLGNDLQKQVDIDQRQMLQLLPGGWQAIPIDIDQPNQPHLLEIEYLADQPMAMGVSLLQPDSSGQIPLYGFDSGVVVPDAIVEPRPAKPDGRRFIHQHRIVFWPQIKQPYLLIANRDTSHPATVGEIRVYSGPDRLPSSQLESPNLTDSVPRRKFMAFYESPCSLRILGQRKKSMRMSASRLMTGKCFMKGPIDLSST